MSQKLISGYLVTYCERDFTGSCGDHMELICSLERLIYLLICFSVSCNNFSYHVISAQYINVQEYLQNHDNQPEIWL